MRTSFCFFLFDELLTFTAQEHFCRSTRKSFLPLLFQRRFLARFLTKSLGGVSHSDGHSVVNKDKKPVHRYQNKRKIIFRYSFDENLCTGFEIQMPQCLYLSRFCTQTVQCEAFAVISAYRRSQCFIGYSVVVLVWGYSLYIIKQMFVNTFFGSSRHFLFIFLNWRILDTTFVCQEAFVITRAFFEKLTLTYKWCES